MAVPYSNRYFIVVKLSDKISLLSELTAYIIVVLGGKLGGWCTAYVYLMFIFTVA